MSNILHLLRTSGFERQDFVQCIALCQASDICVLIDDGCYNTSHPEFETLKQTITAANIFVIGHHSVARGLTIPENVKAITLAELASLIATANKTITWQ